MFRFLIRSAFIIACTAGMVSGQSTSALINEKLDRLVEINVDTTLPQAVDAIKDKTAVPIVVTRGAYDALPWGEQTKLTTKISDRTLRDALTAIVQTLGLTFRVEGESLLIEPQPALVRLGTRATVQDLNLLSALATNTLGGVAGNATVADLLARIDTRLQELKLPFAIENRAGEALGGAAVQIPRDATLLAAIEAVVAQSRATWYPWQNSVLVVPKEDHVRMLLDKTITMRFNGVDVSQVLTELSRRSGVAITVEPGAVQRVPAESRTIKLVLENVSVRPGDGKHQRLHRPRLRQQRDRRLRLERRRPRDRPAAARPHGHDRHHRRRANPAARERNPARRPPVPAKPPRARDPRIARADEEGRVRPDESAGGRFVRESWWLGFRSW
jgi:hypothetical protein